MNPAQNRLEHRSKTGSRTQRGWYWEWFYKAVISFCTFAIAPQEEATVDMLQVVGKPPNIESGHGNALQMNTILRTERAKRPRCDVVPPKPPLRPVPEAPWGAPGDSPTGQGPWARRGNIAACAPISGQ